MLIIKSLFYLHQSLNRVSNFFKKLNFPIFSLKSNLSSLFISNIIRLFLFTKFCKSFQILFCHLSFLEMKIIHKLTKIICFSFREHKFECFETFFGFEICQLKVPVAVSCLTCMYTLYFPKVNAQRGIEILLVEEISVMGFNEIIGFYFL